MSETERAFSCFICTANNVCRGKDEVLTSYLMFKEYWKDNGEWDALLFLLASKCKYYNFVGEEAFSRGVYT